MVISGPAGVGKTTVVSRLLETPGLTRSISATSRPPRKGEQDGRDYRFTTRERFEKGVRDGDFLEHAKIHGQWYGTPLRPIEEGVAAGKVMILAIDVQGARSLRALQRDFLGIFLMPPSMEELQRRLTGRSDTPAEEVERRLAHAVEEMREKDSYDVVVVNETVDGTVRKIRGVLQERHII